MVDIYDYDGTVRKRFNELSGHSQKALRKATRDKTTMKALAHAWPGMNKEDIGRELVDMAHEFKVRKGWGL